MASLDLSELLQAVTDSAMSDLHVAIPGKVVTYYANDQTADVLPLTQRLVPDPDGNPTPESLPMIPKVPVLMLRGRGFFLHVPLQAGDTVLLLFTDLDHQGFRTTGDVSPPEDHRVHDLGNAVALPGFVPRAKAIAGLAPDRLTLGHEGDLTTEITATTFEIGGSSDAAAKASVVDSLISAFNSHTHLIPAAPGTSDPPLPTASGPSGSAVLKVGS